MKKVSQHFIDETLSARKQIMSHILVAWDKVFDPVRGFFTLDSSTLDGGSVLWNGNQDVAAFADRYEYADESENCASWSVSQKASKHPWGVIQGTAKIVFNNASGRYFPGNDPVIGEYVGLPNRPIKIQQEIDGESINVFTGYTQRPSVTIQKSQMTITAFDALAFLSGFTSELEPIAHKRIDEIIGMLLIEAGFVESQFVLEEGIQEEIGFCAPNGEKTITTLQKLCESEQYLLFADGDGLIHGWNANHFTIETDPIREFNKGNSTAMSWASSSILNDVRVTAEPYKQAESAGVFYLMDGGSDDTLVPANDSLELFISPEDDKNNAIYGLDVSVPVYDGEGTSCYRTCVEQNGEGDTNAGAISVSAFYVMNGKTIRIIFRNDSDIPTYITHLSFYGTYAKKTYYSPVEVSDKSSMEDYGVNPDESSSGEVYDVENEYIQDRKFAKRVAELLVENYAQPYGQISLSVFPTPYVEFGDIVSAHTGIEDGNKRGIIFGMELTGGANGKYTQKISIEQRAEIYSFKLDSSKLDSGHVLAY